MVKFPHEERRQERRQIQPLKVTFLGAEYTAVNWSRSGFLIADRIPHVVQGTVIEGILRVAGSEGRYRFSAELMRRDKRSQEIAFRFVASSPALLQALGSAFETI